MTTDHDPRDIEAANIALAKFPFTGRVSRDQNLALECARIARLMAEGKWPEEMPEDAEAREIVDAIFADLRDRRWLKWLFAPPGSGEFVRPGAPRIDDEAQEEIAASWRGIIKERIAIKRQKSQASASDREG